MDPWAGLQDIDLSAHISVYLPKEYYNISHVMRVFFFSLSFEGEKKWGLVNHLFHTYRKILSSEVWIS